MSFFQEIFIGQLSWLDIFIRVVIAVLIGLTIGVERELANHPAGMKTHALVCLGAAVTTMISTEMSFSLMGDAALDAASKVDISRIASGVVSGIGFIGAGAIIKTKDGSFVTGITTAATVWISGCMGLAVGMGYFKIITVAMMGILFTTITLKGLEARFIKNRGTRFIEVITNNKSVTLPQLEDYFDRKQITVTSFSCTVADEDEDDDENKTLFCCRYFLRIPKGVPFSVVMKDIAKMEEISEVYESSPDSASAKKQKKVKG